MSFDAKRLRALFSGITHPRETHRPMLCEAVMRTTGPMLELGMGDGSTRALHAAAELCGRTMHSYDHDSVWTDRYRDLRSDRHAIVHVASYDECPIEAAVWGVALVDHAPAERRAVDIRRLAQHARVLVVHDSEDLAYGYDRILDLFKHQGEDRERSPRTLLLSNHVDVGRWLRPRKSRALRISMVVPCAASHVARLPELLPALRSQSRVPEEVVVVVSGCADVVVPDLGNITVVQSVERLSAGAARNRGTKAATGDVVIYQDADDIPHPQRVEIVAALFELYMVEHVSHFFYKPGIEDREFSLAEAITSSSYTGAIILGITNGNVAVTRDLALRVRWPEHFSIGEDQEFNRACYAASQLGAVTRLPLLAYRQQFSTNW